MLARDPTEAADQARIVLKEKPLAAYYDEILLEGLRLAQADARRDLLDDDRLQRIRDVVAEIVDDLSTHRTRSSSTDNPAEGDSPLVQLEKAEAKVEQKGLPERWRNSKPVLCIPGPNLLNEAIAMVVAHLVEQKRNWGASRKDRCPIFVAISKLGNGRRRAHLPLLCSIYHTGSDSLCHSPNSAAASQGVDPCRVAWK